MGLGRENRGARARPRSERRSRGSRAGSCTADRVRGINEKHSLVTLTHRYPGRRAAGFLARMTSCASVCGTGVPVHAGGGGTALPEPGGALQLPHSTRIERRSKPAFTSAPLI